jgi:hypothetical protein
MPTALNGNKLGVYVDNDNNAGADADANAGGATTSPRLLALATNATLSYSNATVEVSTKQTKINADGSDDFTLLNGTSKTHSLAGASSFTISCEGLLDLSTPSADDDNSTAGDTSDDTLGTDAAGEATSEHGFVNLMDMALTRRTVLVEFRDASASSNFGTKYRGKAFIESIEASGGVDDFATYSVTFKGDGDLSAI